MDGALSEQSILLPEAEERLCRQYGRARLALCLAELAVPLVVLAGITLSGAAADLLAWSRTDGWPAWVGHFLFLLLVGCICRASLLPVQFLGEHWLDRRFGLSRQGALGWLWEWFCRSAVSGVALAVALLPVVETLRWWPWLMLLWGAAFLPCRRLFYDLCYYPLLARFYPVSFLRRETFELPGVGRKTLPVYQVRVSHKTRRANAGIRIRGAKTAIYVTDTLIDAFTDGEERLVMAHEFGHLYDQLHLEARTPSGIAQAHRKLALGSAQLAAGGLSLCLMHFAAPILGLRGVQDLAGFPLIAALALLLTLAVSPWLCAEARRDERDADQYALAITGDVASYVSVMRKLRRVNLEESCSGPLSRFLFDTHPSYRERIRLAAEYRRRHSPRRKTAHWRGWRHIQRHGRR